MHVGHSRPVEPETEPWIAPVAEEYVQDHMKSAVTLTAFAIAILASGHLAFYNSSRWLIVATTVSVINLYSLPKILHYGNDTVIKWALIANLSALGGLFIGGIGAYVLKQCQAMITSINTSQFSSAFAHAFIATALIGYLLPLFGGTIDKTYRLINYPSEWLEKIANLKEQFHRLPELGLGFLQTNLWQCFILQLSLLQPEYLLSYLPFFFIRNPDYIWALGTATSENVTLEQFQDMLSNMEHFLALASLQGDDIPQHMQENFRNRLKIALRALNQNDLKHAIPILVSSGSKLIPSVLSNEQFLEFFVKDALQATDACIQEFLDMIICWDELAAQHHLVTAEITQLELDVQVPNLEKLPPDEKEILIQRHSQIIDNFSALRQQVERIFLYKRTWQNFAPLWDDAFNLPFEQGAGLILVLQDQALLNQIDQIYLSYIGSGHGVQTLCDKLQFIKNKLLVLENPDEEEEAVAAYMCLAANHGFIQKDFEEIQQWLNVDSLNDIEEAMSNIGLATEEDLYIHDILPELGEISKPEVLDKLRHFIENALKADKAAGLVKLIDKDEEGEDIAPLSERVTRVVYYTISSGLILVPLFIYPKKALSFFTYGTVFFILTRFEIPGIVDLSVGFHDLMHILPLVHSFYSRHVISLTPRQRDVANQFVKEDFFGKMRIINAQILSAGLVSYVSFPFAGIGSALQAVFLADELVSSV